MANEPKAEKVELPEEDSEEELERIEEKAGIPSTPMKTFVATKKAPGWWKEIEGRKRPKVDKILRRCAHFADDYCGSRKCREDGNSAYAAILQEAGFGGSESGVLAEDSEGRREYQ